MSLTWRQLSLAAAALMGLLSALGQPTPAVAAPGTMPLLVVEAQGTRFVPGDEVDQNQPMVLRAGQRVTLMARDGSIVTLNGPWTSAPMPAHSDHTFRLSGLMAQIVESLEGLFSIQSSGMATLAISRFTDDRGGG